MNTRDLTALADRGKELVAKRKFWRAIDLLSRAAARLPGDVPPSLRADIHYHLGMAFYGLPRAQRRYGAALDHVAYAERVLYEAGMKFEPMWLEAGRFIEATVNCPVVFISYEHGSPVSCHLARVLAGALQKSGARVLKDDLTFGAGLTVIQEIEIAMQRATCFVGLVGRQYRSRPYCDLELTRAYERTQTTVSSTRTPRVVVILLEGVRIDELPDLKATQVIYLDGSNLTLDTTERHPVVARLPRALGLIPMTSAAGNEGSEGAEGAAPDHGGPADASLDSGAPVGVDRPAPRS